VVVPPFEPVPTKCWEGQRGRRRQKMIKDKIN